MGELETNFKETIDQLGVLDVALFGLRKKGLAITSADVTAFTALVTQLQDTVNVLSDGFYAGVP